MPEKAVRIVYVEWVDSISFGASIWTSQENVLKSAELPKITSVGFLLSETVDYLVLAAHMGDGSVSGDMKIPKVAVKKRRWLSK